MSSDDTGISSAVYAAVIVPILGIMLAFTCCAVRMRRRRHLKTGGPEDTRNDVSFRFGANDSVLPRNNVHRMEEGVWRRPDAEAPPEPAHEGPTTPLPAYVKNPQADPTGNPIDSAFGQAIHGPPQQPYREPAPEYEPPREPPR